jgi:hypothetical protein
LLIGEIKSAKYDGADEDTEKLAHCMQAVLEDE